MKAAPIRVAGTEDATGGLPESALLETRLNRFTCLPRLGLHGLGGILFGADGRWRDGKTMIKQVFVPRIVQWALTSQERCFLLAPIVAQGLVETDDEPSQGRGVAKGVHAREPGHPPLAGTGFLVIPAPEVEDGHAEIGVALDRNQDGAAGACWCSGCRATRNCRATARPWSWRSSDTELELVEAEALVVAAVAEALVTTVPPVKMKLWLVAARVGGWNELSAGSAGLLTTGPPDSPEAATWAKTKMVSEPALLTRTLNCPPALLTTSIALGTAGRPPWACKVDVTVRPSPVGLRRLDVAIGEGHHDLTRSPVPARPAPADRSRPRGRRAVGFDEVEPNQVSAGRHRIAQTAVAHEGGGLRPRALPRSKRVSGSWSLKKPRPTPGSSVMVPLPPLKTARSRMPFRVEILRRPPRSDRRRRT